MVREHWCTYLELGEPQPITSDAAPRNEGHEEGGVHNSDAHVVVKGTDEHHMRAWEELTQTAQVARIDVASK